MEKSLSSAFNSLTAALHLAACVVGIAMLLSFPATRAHNFATHFRTPEVRRSVERNTFIAHGESSSPERIACSELLPTFFTPTETDRRITSPDNFALPSQVPLSRLLHRRKLNPARSNGPDLPPQA
jgi:hypothetical protein